MTATSERLLLLPTVPAAAATLAIGLATRSAGIAAVLCVGVGLALAVWRI
jgi:hypothetical protein